MPNLIFSSLLYFVLFILFIYYINQLALNSETSLSLLPSAGIKGLALNTTWLLVPFKNCIVSAFTVKYMTRFELKAVLSV